MIVAPASAKIDAMPLPTPRPAPVIMATRLSSLRRSNPISSSPSNSQSPERTPAAHDRQVEKCLQPRCRVADIGDCIHRVHCRTDHRGFLALLAVIRVLGIEAGADADLALERRRPFNGHCPFD